MENLDIQQMAENGVIDVFYPYVNGVDKFEELRYSLRSLEQYAQFPFRVVIVGDLPKWINPEMVKHIPHDRVWSDVLSDAISKLKTFIEKTDNPNNQFVRMYDDIYLIAPVSWEEISKVKCGEELTESTWMYKKLINPTCSMVYWDQFKNTYKAIAKVRPQVINTESHCPEVFHKGQMDFVLAQFNVGEEKLLTSTLYYNYWHETLTAIKWGEVKAGFTGKGLLADKRVTVVRALEGKLYLNHNDQGCNPVLQSYIRWRFRDKSKYEK